jgi:hypothetical protein
MGSLLSQHSRHPWVKAEPVDERENMKKSSTVQQLNFCICFILAILIGVCYIVFFLKINYSKGLKSVWRAWWIFTHIRTLVTTTEIKTTLPALGRPKASLWSPNSPSQSQRK